MRGAGSTVEVPRCEMAEDFARKGRRKLPTGPVPSRSACKSSTYDDATEPSVLVSSCRSSLATRCNCIATMYSCSCRAYARIVVGL